MCSLRLAVYLVLAAVFLLPAMQSWDETKAQSKVVVLFDVSGSMGHRDDIPTEATPADKLPTRQDKVLSLLSDDKLAFLKRLQDKNPVFAYRFGGNLDEDYVVLDNGLVWTRSEWEDKTRGGDKRETPAPEGKPWTRAEWEAWLKPVIVPEPDDLKDEDKAAFRKRKELLQTAARRHQPRRLDADRPEPRDQQHGAGGRRLQRRP